MRKLDSLGCIQGHCIFLTDMEIIIKVKNNLKIYDSMAEIKWTNDAASVQNKDDHATKMVELTPKSGKRLNQGWIYFFCKSWYIHIQLVFNKGMHCFYPLGGLQRYNIIFQGAVPCLSIMATFTTSLLVQVTGTTLYI